MDCLFCKIANGEIPSEIVYEDDIVSVFLDIRPNTNGDSLIVPKKHFKDFREVDDETLIHMHNVMRKLYPMYVEKLKCEGLTLCHNTDYGQEIKHFHIHFIPRYKDDEVKHFSNKEKLLDIKDIKEKLKNID
jgi:histidine triad (HIT) family protein